MVIKWVKIPSVLSFRLKFDDVTMTLSLIVLSRMFFGNVSRYYFTPQQILLRLSHLHGWKNRSIFSPWGGGGGGEGKGEIVATPSSTLSLSNFRAKTVGPI